MKSFTRYYYPRNDGMQLRSGRVINCVMNDKEWFANAVQIRLVINETNVTKNKCKLLQSMFTWMDKYHSLIVNDVNFIDNHRVLRGKFDEFISTFESEYYDSKTKKNKGKYFCKCCPKLNASEEDIRNGKPEAFEKELHDNEETRQQLVKWAMFLKQPHRKYKEAHSAISNKTNQDIAQRIIGFL